MKPETIIEGLHKGICTVRFTKANGEDRTMQCTLHPSYLPETQILTEKQNTNPQTITVWDIEQKGWRSFRVESVERFNTTEMLKG